MSVERKFKVGDVVSFSSGNPMTIEKIGEHSIDCMWVNAKGDKCRGSFNPSTLVLSSPKDG